MTVLSHYFRQCLLHRMRDAKGECHEYILPYAFDLDEENYIELGERLCEATGFSRWRYRKQLIARLKDESITDRLEKVTLAQDDVGLWKLTWQGVGRFGLPAGYFVVASYKPALSLDTPMSLLNNRTINTA